MPWPHCAEAKSRCASSGISVEPSRIQSDPSRSCEGPFSSSALVHSGFEDYTRNHKNTCSIPTLGRMLIFLDTHTHTHGSVVGSNSFFVCPKTNHTKKTTSSLKTRALKKFCGVATLLSLLPLRLRCLLGSVMVHGWALGYHTECMISDETY